MTLDPLAEIRRIRTRLAELEALAAQPPPISMGTALEDHFSPTKPPSDPARRHLEAIARGFVPDPQSETALVARAQDVAGYERALRAMGADPLALSLYARQRDAAIATGAWTPPTAEGDPKP